MFWVALFRNLISKVSHPPYHLTKNINILLVLVVLAQLQQLIQQKKRYWAQIIIVFAEMIIANL